MLGTVTRILSLSVFLAAAAVSQAADITGWHDLPWGTKKPAASKALQPLHVHECRAGSACAESAGPDGLAIEGFRLDGALYEVGLGFSPRSGLSRVTMTAKDEKGALDRALADLTATYGKPEFQSLYDDDEQIRTRWIWAKPHGKASIESQQGVFRVTYEAAFESGLK